MLQVTPETIQFLRTEQKRFEAQERRREAIAVRKRGRRLNEKSIAQLVGTVAHILRAGEPTKFEYEGACRHGLRQSLVLRGGWNWTDANAAATEVVAGALQILGAKRPTWDEGQLDAAALHRVERHFCARCGTAIPDERRHNGTPAKYCSNLCGTAARLDKGRRSGERVSAAEHLTALALKSAQTVRERSGPCETCGKPVITARAGRRFCSLQCAHRGQQVRQPKPCAECGAMFKPRVKAGTEARFCSKACTAKAKEKPIEPRACKQCSMVFTPAFNRDQPYCSRACHGASKVKPRPEVVCKTCRGIFRQKWVCKPQIYCSPTCNPRSPVYAGRSGFNCEETR